MKKCVIFGAAECSPLLAPIGDQDRILAADGGLRHTQALGLIPHEILGDFDSLGYIPGDASVFPVEKDDTDTMLAIRRGLELGFREFWIYGGLDGPRLDHTVANFQALQYLADRGAFGYLIGKTCLVTVVKDGMLRFSAGSGGTISVFCMGAPARGVTLEGLYYPLREGTLTAGFPLGVSNHFTPEAASVSVKDGSLLVLWDRSAGIPRRS